jgi:hypothetical protein
MLTQRLAASAFALAVLGLAGAAHAEPLAGAQILARAGEFRGDTHSGRGFESHIWRFATNGQARAIVTVKRGLSALNGFTYETGDAGTWTVQGNTLCVDWQGENRRFSGCYAVEARQGNHVRLVGPAQWEGTLDR